MSDRATYVLVDGENIDATLGQSILGRRPNPHERPRWDRLLHAVTLTPIISAAVLVFGAGRRPRHRAPSRRAAGPA